MTDRLYINGEPQDIRLYGRNIWYTQRTGNYLYSPLVIQRQGGANGTVLDAANRLWAIPFPMARAMTIDRIFADVTAQVGQKIRLGIYKNGANNAPGSLLLDAGEITLGGTGVQALTISQSLAADLYWFAIVSDATPTIRDFNTAAIPLNAFDSPTWYVAHTYGVLPNPFGTPTADYRFWGLGYRILTLD